MDSKKRKSLNLGDIIRKMNEAESKKSASEINRDPLSKSPIAKPVIENQDKPSQSKESETSLPTQPSFGQPPQNTPKREFKVPKAEIFKPANIKTSEENQNKASHTRDYSNNQTSKSQSTKDTNETDVSTRDLFNKDEVVSKIEEIRENNSSINKKENALNTNPLPRDYEEEEEFNIFKYINIILRRKEIVLFIMVIAGIFSTVNFLKAQKFYTARARLLFMPDQNDVLENSGRRVFGKDRDKMLNTHLELLKSDIVLERVLENMELSETKGIGSIRGGLMIREGMTGGEANNIVELSIRNTDAEFARDALNELLRTYISYRREVNAQEDTRLILKLETQIEKLESDLKVKEDALRKFKEANQILQLSKDANIVVTKLADMELQLQKTQLNLLETRDRLSSLQSQISKQDLNIVQSFTYESPMGARLSQLQLELNTLTAEYSEDHFKIKNLRSQIENIKKAMTSNINKEISNNAVSKTLVKNPIRESLLQTFVNQTIELSTLEAKRLAQEKIIEKLKVEMGNLPSLEQKFATLTRESESLLQTLKKLKVEHVQAKIRRESKESELKILEMAKLPKVAISSKKTSSILIGIIVGLLIGVAIAFLLEFLDQTFKEPSDIENTLEIPLLGMVPLIETDNAVVEKEDISKTVLEPFRALRANLKHIAQEHNAKLFMICSAVKGEGKTTLSTNLAITFSLDEKKVIIVDCDLRRSQVHSLLNIQKENGVSEYLQNKCTIDDIIKPTAFGHLFVVTAGNRPSNPAELLGIPRFKTLLKELKERADMVIIDSPALIPVSDTMTMAPLMDFTVMIVRSLWTPLKAALQAKNQLSRIGTNIVGGIMNGISHGKGYYPYYYGYYGYYGYHSYKYTYDYDSDPKKPFTIREFGLTVEKKSRELISDIPMLFRRYSTLLIRQMSRLFSERLFLLLIFMICIVLGVRYFIYRNQSTISDSPSRIEMLEPAISNEIQSQSPEAIQVLESETENKTETFSAKDSVSKWIQALNNLSIAQLKTLYSSSKFYHPKFSLNDWLKEKTIIELKKDEKGSIIIRSNTIISSKTNKDDINLKFTIEMPSGKKIRITSLWSLDDSGSWRITREKRTDISGN